MRPERHTRRCLILQCALQLSCVLVACAADPAVGRDPRQAAGAGSSGSGGAAAGAGAAATSGGAGTGSGFGNSDAHIPDRGDALVPPPAADAGVIVRDPECGNIVAKVRDFSPTTHPDFERALGFDWNTLFGNQKGIVKPVLENGYPAYAAIGSTSSTAGPAEFYQWYVDTPGVNMSFEVPITLIEDAPGRFVYDSAAFFPIDGQGFGNEGNPHNFHFTTEVRTRFTYQGGEVFTFRGDDDLWLFVNQQLVLDLGGLHGALEGTVLMDQVAAQHGLVAGETYAMDIFHAERHTVESNFRIETTISCFVVVPPPPPPPPPVIE